MENTDKHTSYPWEMRPIGIGTPTDHSGYAVFQKDAPESGGRICHIPQSESKHTRANAWLIAAAPALLETVKYALQNALNDREEFLRTHTDKHGSIDEDAAFMFAEIEADIELYTSAINGAVGDV